MPLFHAMDHPSLVIARRAQDDFTRNNQETDWTYPSTDSSESKNGGITDEQYHYKQPKACAIPIQLKAKRY